MYRHQWMRRGAEKERRANFLEVVGAWLHIWVPPRDVFIPDVPWKKLGIGFGIGAVVLAAALAVMIPRIDHTKSRNAALYRADRARADRAYRERIIKLQRPRHAAAPSARMPANASAAERAAAREGLVHRVEASILADAKSRAATGEIRPVEGPTTCDPAAGSPTTGPVGVFDCFVVTVPIKATTGNIPGSIGYPFRAVVNFDEASYTWCKTEQVPGEMLVLAPDKVVHLPPECQAPKGS
jgi:hypothetical protein